MYEVKKGNLRFFSRHQALNNEAYNMSSMINDPKVLKLNINIYVGIHQFRKKYLQKNGYNLGIQTEQLFDEMGNRMWRKQKKHRMLRDVIIYDKILDLSEHNKPSYVFLPKFFHSKLDFGPYIFPKVAIKKSPLKGEKYIFYGSLNNYRDAIIEKTGNNLVEIVKTDTYGKNLSKMISESRAVLNIHYKKGIYTEWPRILSAYLHGKVIISEQLSSIMVAGKHYINIDDNFDKNYEEIFSNFSNEIARKYSLEDYLLNNLRVKK